MYDPPFFVGGSCPGNTQCRWSDVTFVAYDSGVSRSQGYIAQTLYREFGSGQAGSIDINPSFPTFDLAYAPQLPVVGTYIDKVGENTGWTSGTVSNTCIDTSFVGHTILCSEEVNASAAGGDSGSPAFEWIDQTHGAFCGIVYYATGQGGYRFSYVDQIAKDMGAWVTYGPN